MEVERIVEFDDAFANRIIELMDLIEDKELNRRVVVDHLQKSTSSVGLFGIFDDEDELQGFLYFEAPEPAYAGRGYLYIAAINPSVPRKYSSMALEMGKEWLMGQGATYFWTWTPRSPEALNRVYGLEVVEERQMICPLVGDDYLKIPLDRRFVNVAV